jgi:hypothetical protein
VGEEKKMQQIQQRFNKRGWAVLLTVLLLALTVSVTFAGNSFTRTVGAGETVNEDVTVFNDDLEVLVGGTINGDVVVMSGDAYVAGTVIGDLVLFNGDLTLESSATIDGDCVLLNGEQINIDGVNISCVTSGELPLFSIPGVPGAPEAPKLPTLDVVSQPSRSVAGTIATIIGNMLVVGILAAIAAAIVPDHLRRIASAAQEKPVSTGTVGVLTVVAVPALMVLLAVISALLVIVCIGLLGIPLLILIAVAFAAAIVLGWIAVGKLIGDVAAKALKLKTPSLIVRTVLGVLLLTLVIALLNTFTVGAVIAAFATFILGAMGLGAVTLTKFGTKPYPRIAEPDEDKLNSVMETLPPDDFDSAESAPSTD